MSQLEAGLRTYLLTIPTITNVVNDRIYGILRQQSQDLPALLIQRVSTQRQRRFCPTSTSDLVSADLQVDSYAMGGDAGWALARATRKTLIEFHAAMMGDVYVDEVILSNEFPLNDPDPGVIRITQLYNFWYQED